MWACGMNEEGETPFVRFLSFFYRKFAAWIVRRPWIFLIASTIVTIITVARIPFSPLSNDVSDFTPIEARARIELNKYREFFSNKGTPVVAFVLVTAKNEGNMFGLHELHDAVQIMDIVNEKFKVKNSITNQSKSFSEFCSNFCTLNEPVRHFYSGLLVESEYSNSSSSDHIDLGYPITTVLGRQLRLDPNFFGVKVAIASSVAPQELLTPATANGTVTVSVNQLRGHSGHSIFDEDIPQLRNNIREIKLVGLQFRAERPPEISVAEFKKWEAEVVRYFHEEYRSEYVDVVVLTESHLTEEIVAAGLTLIPFLVIGFVIMATFSSITISLAASYMRQMHYSKVALAIMACVCPFMACGAALGLLFFVGFRFGTILCVTPFLVLSIGVDDAYLMINSWQRVKKQMRKQAFRGNNDEALLHLLTEVFVDTAPSITITALTNVLAFGIGALTPTPEIQLFSIGNAAAIILDYIFQWTIYGSFMAIMGRIELKTDGFPDQLEIESAPSVSDKPMTECWTGVRRIFSTFIKKYCKILTNGIVSSIVMALLAVYVYGSVTAIMTTEAELQPDKLFLKNSDVMRIMYLRDEYVMPFYAVCMVFVNKPGNLSNPEQVQKWHRLVTDFEALPSSLGRFSTKFWLRDYEEFVANAEETSRFAASEEEQEEGSGRKRNELRQFLEWPEFQHWRGFLNLKAVGDDMRMNKFFFTTASYGPQLKQWSSRARLLDEWRRVADSFPELEVTIYEDDAKFLDLIPTLIPQMSESSWWTFVCMIVVCLLFMTHPSTVAVASMAIFSTCLGVFGALAVMGVKLDPIVMSSGIMSIGFSVDIPAHIAYHFYKSGLGKSGAALSVPERLEHTLVAVGFPIVEASVSTIICVLSLSFVDLHMAQVFVKTMVLVVSIGLLHGVIAMPVVFNLLSLVPRMRGSRIHDGKLSAASTTVMIRTSDSASDVCK